MDKTRTGPGRQGTDPVAAALWIVPPDGFEWLDAYTDPQRFVTTRFEQEMGLPIAMKTEVRGPLLVPRGSRNPHAWRAMWRPVTPLAKPEKLLNAFYVLSGAPIGKDKAAIKAFADEWGWLGGIEMRAAARIRWHRDPAKEVVETGVIAGEPLEDWREVLAEFRDLVDLIDAFPAALNGAPAAQHAILARYQEFGSGEYHPKPGDVWNDPTVAGEPALTVREPGYLVRIGQGRSVVAGGIPTLGSQVEAARQAVAKKINARLQGHFQVAVDPDRLALMFWPNSLLAMIHYALALRLVGAPQMRRCANPECSEMFPAIGKARFHSDACKDRYHYLKRKGRLK